MLDVTGELELAGSLTLGAAPGPWATGIFLSFIPFPCHPLHSFTLFTISYPLHSYHILFLPLHSILGYLLLFLHLHPSFIFDIPVAFTSFNSIGISLLMSLGDCLCQLNLSHWFKIGTNISCKILGKRMVDHLRLFSGRQTGWWQLITFTIKHNK